MSCARVRPDLVAFHFGDVDPEGRAVIEHHLAVCPGCLLEFLDTKRAIETAEAEPEPSTASRERLRRAVAAELTAPRQWSWWERPFAFGLAAASVLLALVAVHQVSASAGTAPHAMEAVNLASPP